MMLTRSKALKRGGYVNKRGPRTKAWEKARRQLKWQFAQELNVLTCELNYTGCWHDNGLGFAHAAKRRKLKPEDLQDVILACNHCHDQLEVMPAEEMHRIVIEKIADRTDRIMEAMF